MSCRAVIIAITPTGSPFTMEARSVLVRSSLPLMRHHSIFRTLEELAASSAIWAAAKLSAVAVNVFHEQSSYALALLHKQIELLGSSDPSDPFGQGLQLSGPTFHLVGFNA
jgi:hypothetical protein